MDCFKIGFINYFGVAVFFLLGLSGCSRDIADNEPPAFSLTSSRVAEANDNEPIRPLPLMVKLDQSLVALGNTLFHDKRLSADDSVSCASCHNIEAGGADSNALSKGINDQLGSINTPTVFNSHYNFRQFWDGRASSLEEQIDGPITNPVEMGASWPEVISKLESDEYYSEVFQQIFDDGITEHNIKLAIATFERSLITPNSSFDQYLNGDENVLSKKALEGYQLFKQLGCIACHQGVNVGGNMYQHFGVMGDYFADRGNITDADYGLYNVTGKDTDRYKFKVPSLRNVSETAPYFHDGQTATLDEAVKIMGRYQLGIELSQEEVNAIVAFLNSLTGELLASQ